MSIWAIVPAAGVGARVGADRPKQYLTLGERTIVEITLDKLAQVQDLAGIVVAVSDDDGYWADQQLPSSLPVARVSGGSERCESVLNALNWLAEHQQADWVMVHDVARPCVDVQDIENLIAKCIGANQGGLLAVPATDTLKLAAAGAAQSTVDRSQIWHALTPQMFPLAALKNNLTQALENNNLVTDDASAMELAGVQPLLIEGRRDNIKITRPEDLALAKFYLMEQ